MNLSFYRKIVKTAQENPKILENYVYSDYN